MYTSCLNYGKRWTAHTTFGILTNRGCTKYAVNHINTVARVPDTMTDTSDSLAVQAGTSMYGLTELGGLVAGESVVVIGPGPIGLLAAAGAKGPRARAGCLAG